MIGILNVKFDLNDTRKFPDDQPKDQYLPNL